MPGVRVRREPPRFRRVAVRLTSRLTPRLVRVTLAGPELEGFAVDQPAASVRLLLPGENSDGLVMPAWNGNEFLLADGRRPHIRTFTPLRAATGPDGPELDVEIVTHGGGVAGTWAASAERGWPAAVSGPGRGYAVDPHAAAYVLAGDETAVPAIGQLLAALPPAADVDVHIEVADAAAVPDLPAHPGARVTWHPAVDPGPPGEALAAAVAGAEVGPESRVWAAGEAAAVQRIRRHLFEERGVPRARASVRGYWKFGRSGDDADDGE